jgi:hypothetical protein
MKTTLREDLTLRDYARELGFTIETGIGDRSNNREIDYTDPAKCPYFPLQFKKGNKTIWACGRGGWACADLTGNGVSPSIQYRNHRYYKSLLVALDTEQLSKN